MAVRYIALGDSISIDIYPASDAASRGLRASTNKLGAASLFFRNDDKLWPEFRGRDLRSRFPGIDFTNLTSDGATTDTLLRQVERISKRDEQTLVTITIGGNDLLGEIGWAGDNPAPEIADRARTAVARILDKRPSSLIILTNVYDPTDGTNRLPGFMQKLDRAAEWLRDYNERLRSLTATDARLRYADIRTHFHGHGVSVPEDDWWYLRGAIIEPGVRGASEVRRVWWETLDRPAPR